jgi:hypothetical protein
MNRGSGTVATALQEAKCLSFRGLWLRETQSCTASPRFWKSFEKIDRFVVRPQVQNYALSAEGDARTLRQVVPAR